MGERSNIDLVGNTTIGGNIGDGIGIYACKVCGNNLQFKTLLATGNSISIISQGDSVYISGSSGNAINVSNGLSISGDTIELGGQLSKNTNIDLNNSSLNITGGTSIPFGLTTSPTCVSLGNYLNGGDLGVAVNNDNCSIILNVGNSCTSECSYFEMYYNDLYLQTYSTNTYGNISMNQYDTQITHYECGNINSGNLIFNTTGVCLDIGDQQIENSIFLNSECFNVFRKNSYKTIMYNNNFICLFSYDTGNTSNATVLLDTCNQNLNISQYYLSGYSTIDLNNSCTIFNNRNICNNDKNIVVFSPTGITYSGNNTNYVDNSIITKKYLDEHLIGWSNSTNGSTVIGCNNILDSCNTYYNTFVGVCSGGINICTGNTRGYGNVAIGFEVLTGLTRGCYNIGIGYQTLINNNCGCHNIANGYQALYCNTYGYGNIANGYQALYTNTYGNCNIANGSNALYCNTYGNYNIANGSNTLYCNTCGNYNIANGDSALYSNNTGDYNIANGSQALANNTTGCNNIANGYGALFCNISGCSNIANGYNALYRNISGNNNIVNGEVALYNNTIGSNNIANGNRALMCNISGSSNIANGYQALRNNRTGWYNIANGYNALLSNTTGCDNIANGYNVLTDNTTGNNNIANGRNALTNNTTGSNNIANGSYALGSNTTGYDNIANGNNVLANNTTGYENIANGVLALYYNSTGYENIANGHQALYCNISGSSNIAIGNYAHVYNKFGCNNIVIGAYAGQHITGSLNVMIGNYAGFIESGSSKLYVANCVNCSLIYGEFDNKRLCIDGTLEVSNNSNANYFYLGDKDTDNSWRMYISGNTNLVFERRIGGSWTCKGSFSG